MTQAITRPVSPKSKPERMSYDEFLRRYMDRERLEWVNGRVVPMSPVTKPHDDCTIFLIKLLDEYAKAKLLGEVNGEPYNMKLGYGLPGRSPDILFVAKANLARRHNEYLDGPADLVVEVISLESRKRDRVTKFAEYEQAGVREYWIVDPAKKTADFYLRDNEGKYQPMPVEPEGIVRSVVLEGFWLKTEWLWLRPAPRLLEVVKQWGLL